MSPLRLTGSTSGYSQIDAPAVAGDQTFTLPGTGGTLDRLNRAGNILQVVNATYSTLTTNNTTTYADTGLSASITPTSSSSKILVLVAQAGVTKESGNTESACIIKLVRGSTDLILFAGLNGYTGTSLTVVSGTASATYMDSPNTTSSITYKTQFKNNVNAASAQVQVSSSVSTITLMEIAA